MYQVRHVTQSCYIDDHYQLRISAYALQLLSRFESLGAHIRRGEGESGGTYPEGGGGVWGHISRGGRGSLGAHIRRGGGGNLGAHIRRGITSYDSLIPSRGLREVL